MKKCPDSWLSQTIPYCHVVQSMKSDKKEEINQFC